MGRSPRVLPPGGSRLVRQVECLAEELTHTTENNVRMELRDLALFYLELGDPGGGLRLLAETIRHAPDDPWTFNVMALRLPKVGLPSLGKVAAERGLELVGREGDPGGLRDHRPARRGRCEARSRCGDPPG